MGTKKGAREENLLNAIRAAGAKNPTDDAVRNVIQAAIDGAMSAQTAAEIMFTLFRRR